MAMLDKTIRRRSGLIEQLCEHGVGHPVQESAEQLADQYNHDVSVWLSHGCDGCCISNDDNKRESP